MASTSSNYFQEYLREHEVLTTNKDLVSKLLKAPKIPKKVRAVKTIDAAHVGENNHKVPLAVFFADFNLLTDSDLTRDMLM